MHNQYFIQLVYSSLHTPKASTGGARVSFVETEHMYTYLLATFNYLLATSLKILLDFLYIV